CVGVEEADQGVELAAGAGEQPRRGQRRVQGGGRNPLGVVGRFGGRSDAAAHLARPAAGVGGGAVAEVLLDGARLGGGRAVVVAVPAWVLVEALGPFLRGERHRQKDA